MEDFFRFFSLVSAFFYWLLIATVTFRVILKRRAPGVSIAWLMIIYILPIFGIVLYLLFGELNLGKKRADRAKAMFTTYRHWLTNANNYASQRPKCFSRFASPVHDLCYLRAGIPALAGNKLTLLNQPHEILNSITERILNAKHSIHMIFYIWHLGGEADKVAHAVCLAAKRGLSVRILLDSTGSKAFFKSHWPNRMRSSGVELVEALQVSPTRMFFQRIDIRQHRKIVIIDNLIGYTGSMNLVDPLYFKQNANVGQWIDIMVSIEGPSVPILNSIFSWDWEVETGLRCLTEITEDALEKAFISQHNDANHTTQITPSGPGMPDSIIQQILLLTISQANKKLTITTPYLVPSESITSALQIAAQRGVVVNIIIPAKNDSIMVEWASRSFFYDLLSSGVNIYLFHGGLLHTKSVMVDDSFCLIGTVNLDMRSLWLNFEVTLCVDDPRFCRNLIALQQSYLDNSTKVDVNEWQNRSILNRGIEQFFYMFSPLL